MADRELISVRGLTVRYAGAPAPVFADLGFTLAAGSCLAVVGPSGCGKSTLCRTLLDLLPPGAQVAGSIRWGGQELTADRARWHRLRGRGLGLVLQDHRFALDPVRRIGDQIAEVVRLRQPLARRRETAAVVLDLLAEVRLPEPDLLARRYPHQLSGGQRQRACLAAALAAGPQLLLADEPTTALDLLVQRDIIRLLRDLVDRRRLGLLLVTHDRDLVSLIAERTLAWPDRQPSPAADHHPRADAAAEAEVCLRVRELSAAVATGGSRRIVVYPLSFDLAAGRTLGVVGESGAGKTTLARTLAGWQPPQAGSVTLSGGEGLAPAARTRMIQMISQDATAALDPHQTVLAAIVEAARSAQLAPAAARARAMALLCEVDLEPELARRRPQELSGGQRQRVQLARALAAQPRVLVADEPASSLDGERRRALLLLLQRLQARHGLAILLISHDLAWVERWCDQVAVMLAGHLVELYRPGGVAPPLHPFARDLAAAACGRLRDDPGTRPPPAGADVVQAAPAGCPYAGRCALVEPACRRALPVLLDRGQGHFLRCPVAARQAG